MKWDIKPNSMLHILDELRNRYWKIKMMIIDTESIEKKARVIAIFFKKK